MGESRKHLVGSLVVAFSLLACASSAASPPVITNPWLDQRGILNMAHQGGEFEAPSSTMYAFRTALEDRGADSLEMDVNATSDNRLAVMHDYYTRRITPLDAQVRDLTLAELQELDAAHWFSPGTGQFDHSKPADQYPLRGVRTGAKPPPDGYTAQDFRIPAIEEVLEAFPHVPLNIEIKSVPGDSNEAIRVATLLGQILGRNEFAGRRIIVASLDQNALVTFNQLAPTIGVSAGMTSMISFMGGGALADPRPVALQVPMKLGEFEPPRELQKMEVKKQGLAVHVWTDGAATEIDEAYADLIDSGVQGIITSAPAILSDYLCRAGVRRPDGSTRCPSQVMKYRLSFPTRSLRKALTGGLPVSLTCDQNCVLQSKMSIRTKALRRMGFPLTRRQKGLRLLSIGSLPTLRIPLEAGTTTLKVRVFKKRLLPYLKRKKRLQVRMESVIFDSGGLKVRTDARWLTLKSKRPLKPRR